MDIAQEEDWSAEKPALVWQPLKPARSHLNYWLKSADRHFSRNFGRLLSECDIIASEWAALRELYRPQWRSPVELGQLLGMSKGGASKLVSRLLKKGLVTRLTMEFDRRFRAVGLTTQGRELVEFLAPIEKDVEREFFLPLGNSRRFRLTEWMKRVVDTRRSGHMHQWVSMQMKQKAFPKPDPHSQADADAFWEFCKRVAEAAARGDPPPSFTGMAT